jgi:hypothetical protein
MVGRLSWGAGEGGTGDGKIQNKIAKYFFLLVSIKIFQASGEAFSHPERTSMPLKYEMSLFFLFLWEGCGPVFIISVGTDPDPAFQK